MLVYSSLCSQLGQQLVLFDVILFRETLNVYFIKKEKKKLVLEVTKKNLETRLGCEISMPEIKTDKTQDYFPF